MSRDRDFLLDVIELIETIDRYRPESDETRFRPSNLGRGDARSDVHGDRTNINPRV